MSRFAPAYTVRRLDDFGELHFRFEGLFTLETVVKAQSELVSACKALGSGRGTIRALGDLSKLAVQTRDVSEQIRLTHEAAPTFGVEKMALFGASPLLQQQYRRVQEKMTLEFFDTRHEALTWLRSSSDDR